MPHRAVSERTALQRVVSRPAVTHPSTTRRATTERATTERFIQRVAVAGAELELLVLAADRGGCVGVDVVSGAFVRASYDRLDPAQERLSAFDVVTGRLGEPRHDGDVSRPEAVVLEAPPRRTGHLPPRRVERLLTALHHPRRGPLLGFAGRAVPFWTLTGDRPSLTLVEPGAGPDLRIGPTGWECRFAWQNAHVQFPLGDRRLAARLDRTGWPRCSARMLHHLLGYRVRRLLVVVSPPHEGYCYKVVAALLPGA
jgi:hypothetical protein